MTYRRREYWNNWKKPRKCPLGCEFEGIPAHEKSGQPGFRDDLWTHWINEHSILELEDKLLDPEDRIYVVERCETAPCPICGKHMVKTVTRGGLRLGFQFIMHLSSLSKRRLQEHVIHLAMRGFI